MCFDARYSEAALAREDTELLLAECGAMGCCRHLSSLEGSLEPDGDLREALLQSIALGKQVGDGEGDVWFPKTRIKLKNTVEWSPVSSCGKWEDCGVSVQRWLRRLAVFLDPDGSLRVEHSPSRVMLSDEDCARETLASTSEERFSDWFQCVDERRVLTWDIGELGNDAGDLGVPTAPTRGYLLAHEAHVAPGSFITASLGSGEVLWVEKDGTAWKYNVPCTEVLEAAWVSQVVPALVPGRLARRVGLPARMSPVARQHHVTRVQRIRVVSDRTLYHWLASSDLGGSRWGPRLLVGDRANDYRTVFVEELLLPQRGQLRPAGALGPQYTAAAFKCALSKLGSTGCRDFERLMKPLWGKRSCSAPQ